MAAGDQEPTDRSSNSALPETEFPIHTRKHVFYVATHDVLYVYMLTLL